MSESSGIQNNSSCLASTATKLKNFFSHPTTKKVMAVMLIILIALSAACIVNGTGVLLKRLANFDIFNNSAYGNAYRNMSVLGGALLLGGAVAATAGFSAIYHFNKKKLLPNGFFGICLC